MTYHKLSNEMCEHGFTNQEVADWIDAKTDEVIELETDLAVARAVYLQECQAFDKACRRIRTLHKQVVGARRILLEKSSTDEAQ